MNGQLPAFLKKILQGVRKKIVKPASPSLQPGNSLVWPPVNKDKTAENSGNMSTQIQKNGLPPAKIMVQV